MKSRGIPSRRNSFSPSFESGSGALAEIGEKDGSMILVKSGRFGMYISWKKINAKIPVEYMDDPSRIPLEEAWELIQSKAETVGKKAKDSSSGELHKTAGKKAKDSSSGELPPEPKRPLSSYLIFCAEKRSEVSKNFSSLGATSKELARLWAETSEENRKPYQDLANQAKEEYENKKAEWQKACQVLTGKSKSTVRKSSSPSRIADDVVKRPRSAYVYFCSSKRPEVAEKHNRLGDVSKELARMWKEASTDDRKIFEDIASEDKGRFEREKSQRHAPDSKDNIVVESRRGPSAYMLFCAANRNSIVDENGKKLPLGETTKRLAILWNQCDDATKNDYIQQADHHKAVLA